MSGGQQHWKNRAKVGGILLLVLTTWTLRVFHLGVFPSPIIPPPSKAKTAESQWIDKTKWGIHQLIVSGSPYERGLAEGKFTQKLLRLEEDQLVDKLHRLMPNRLMLEGLMIVAMRWFWGIDRYFDPWMVQEMAGIAESAPHEYDSLADPLTRQVAYHGLHEVGQMMVDQTGDDMGCTALAIPDRNGPNRRWIIGRNFDFEGGPVFDSDKIMKWVFPEVGYPFVSITWAGMVGVVTGVNQRGVYLSLNAAGSMDFARYGTPSTLVLLKALQFSKTAAEAVEIIRQEKMFITDIFVVSDRESGKLFRVEKSPRWTEVEEIQEPVAIANHLVSKRWANDRINRFRRNELTSHYRLERGTELVRSTNPSKMSGAALEGQMLDFLRDKGRADGQPLNLGNRRAIDALIATHSVIYHESENLLFVGAGPGVSGKFVGFDLTKSFAVHAPVVVRYLPADLAVSPQRFASVRAATALDQETTRLARQKKCDEAASIFAAAQTLQVTSPASFTAEGDLAACRGDQAQAKIAWKKALQLHPAYRREVLQLEEKLK